MRRASIDKAPVNSDYLGLIYSVFPNARVIYMQRDPIDTCLSCYFQKFLTGINFALDLSDLVHYYREHRRIMAHWRAVLPPGFILDVPYEELVDDQETWSRKMIGFYRSRMGRAGAWSSIRTSGKWPLPVPGRCGRRCTRIPWLAGVTTRNSSVR